MGLEVLEQPMLDALAKVRPNTGAAGQVLSALGNVADDSTGHAQQNLTDAATVRTGWSGLNAEAFGGAAQPISTALGDAAKWADSLGSTIGQGLGIVESAAQQIMGLISEFRQKASQLLAAAATNPDSGAKAQAMSQVKQLAADYGQKAAQTAGETKSQLQGMQSPPGTGQQGGQELDKGSGDDPAKQASEIIESVSGLVKSGGEAASQVISALNGGGSGASGGMTPDSDPGSGFNSGGLYNGSGDDNLDGGPYPGVDTSGLGFDPNSLFGSTQAADYSGLTDLGGHGVAGDVGGGVAVGSGTTGSDLPRFGVIGGGPSSGADNRAGGSRVSGAAAATTAKSGGGSSAPMYPAGMGGVGGRGEDKEHRRKWGEGDDELFLITDSEIRATETSPDETCAGDNRSG